jgi:predicted phage baseplate assembly protein
VTTAGGHTTLTFVKDLANAFRRDTTTLNANVALATHGETVSEVLGSGNGSQPYQRFTLRQAPLTYVSAQTPSGAASTLQVRANDVLWHEAPTLFGLGARDRVYTARADDDGKVTVLFGDGSTGARLPSGTENVRATYRKGIGKAGNVGAGQISLLMSRPLGLREAVNPVPATGGDDPEPRDQARVNAPLTVLTLGRIVSLRDYEDFARAFAGIAKALATWTWDGERQGVFVTVAGVDGAPVDETGETYKNLVSAMHDAGDPYVSLRVKSYAAVKFKLAAAVTRDQDYLAAKVEADIRTALLSYFAFDRRAFGQPVALSEAMAAIQAVPGVIAVDVNALHRKDLVGGGGVQPWLPANLPQSGIGGSPSPAELLTLAAGDIQLAVP